MFFTFFLTLALLFQIYDATQIICRVCYIFCNHHYGNGYYYFGKVRTNL